MPLVYQQNINGIAMLGLWHIEEIEDFFLAEVPLQKNITHPNKRLQHLAGRYLLKILVPGFPYDLIRIADTRKPFLENEAYHFSISHCGEYAAVLISSQSRVGVDIEKFSRKVLLVKNKFLSAPEQALLEANADNDFFKQESSAITATWSIKEAIYKWYGNGEVDFKNHIHIKQLTTNGSNGIADCSFTKDMAIELEVHFFLFGDNCVSWVIS